MVLSELENKHPCADRLFHLQQGADNLDAFYFPRLYISLKLLELISFSLNRLL